MSEHSRLGAAYLYAGPLRKRYVTVPGSKNDEAYHAALTALASYREAGVLPVTVRQVYYKAIGLGLITKGKKNYHRIKNMLIAQRKDGTIHWSVIRDDTTILTEADRHYRDPDAFKELWTPPSADIYRKRMLDNQPTYMEVLCESAGAAQYIVPIAHKYGIDVTGSGGFDKLTAKYRLLARVRREAEQRNVVIFQLGDDDRSGWQIQRAVEDWLDNWYEAEVGEDGYSDDETHLLIEKAFPARPSCSWSCDDPPKVVRVALLPEHHDDFDLVPNPEGEDKGYELEAMEVHDIQELLEEAILAYWNEEAAEEKRAEIEAERRKLKRWVTTVRKAAFPPKRNKARR